MSDDLGERLRTTINHEFPFTDDAHKRLHKLSLAEIERLREQLNICLDTFEVIRNEYLQGAEWADWSYVANTIRGVRASLAGEKRECTCHPDDNPPVPCARQYALTECRDAALAGEKREGDRV